MGPFMGGHYAGGQGAAAVAGPSRPYLDRAWYGNPDSHRGPGEPIPPRMPFSPEGQLDRPFMGRHFDDPYLYDDNVHGVKRPFYMTVRFSFSFFKLFVFPFKFVFIPHIKLFELILLPFRTQILIIWGLLEFVLDWIIQIQPYFMEVVTMV